LGTAGWFGRKGRLQRLSQLRCARHAHPLLLAALGDRDLHERMLRHRVRSSGSFRFRGCSVALRLRSRRPVVAPEEIRGDVTLLYLDRCSGRKRRSANKRCGSTNSCGGRCASAACTSSRGPDSGTPPAPPRTPPTPAHCSAGQPSEVRAITFQSLRRTYATSAASVVTTFATRLTSSATRTRASPCGSTHKRQRGGIAWLKPQREASIGRFDGQRWAVARNRRSLCSRERQQKTPSSGALLERMMGLEPTTFCMASVCGRPRR
jgi:hypothetical protein